MKKYTAFVALLLACSHGSAQAANFAVVAAAPNLLSLAVMVIAIAGIVLSLKAISIVKGGLLSKGFQVITGGFLTLAFSQIALLINAADVMVLPTLVVPALLAATAGLFCYGIFETGRSLS